MINHRLKKAYIIFKTIAKFNRKKIKTLVELESLRLDVNQKTHIHPTTDSSKLYEEERVKLSDERSADPKSKPVRKLVFPV